MERGWFHGKGFLLGFILHLLLQETLSRPPSPGPPLSESLLTTGKGNTLIINYSGFGQHGVDPAAFQAVFDRKAIGPVTNYSILIHVNITFTLSAIWKCISVDQTPAGLMASMSIVKVTSNTISQWEWSASVNWTPSISPSMNRAARSPSALSPTRGRTRAWAWRRTSRSFQIHHRTSFRARRGWVLLGIHQRAIKVTMATNQYEQAIFYVVIRCRRRRSPYVVNFLVPIDVLSFHLPLESRNYAPLKTTVLLGYSVFLLMMNDLLPAIGTSSHASSVRPHPPREQKRGVYFALCLSLMVDSLLETIFITHLLHVATTHPPPLPRWLYFLLLHCTSPGRCCPTAPQKGNKGLGLTPTHLPGCMKLMKGDTCPHFRVEQAFMPTHADLAGWPGTGPQHCAPKSSVCAPTLPKKFHLGVLRVWGLLVSPQGRVQKEEWKEGGLQVGMSSSASLSVFCFKEKATLLPSIALALTSMGLTLLPSKQYLTERPSVHSPTTASYPCQHLLHPVCHPESGCTAPAADVIPVDGFGWGSQHETSSAENSLGMDVSQTPLSLTAYINSEGQIKYDKPMRVTGICNLDIFYFPFDQQNCTFTFSSFLHTVDGMLLGMDKEVWEITDTSRNVIRTQGEWELLGINKATPKMSMGNNLYDQIMFYVAIRHKPSLYIINLLVPSSFLIAIDALSFYLPAESKNHAPFKITLLLGCNVFLLMMNDLLPASGTLLINVYFALSLSLMVVSLLETVFITYLLHVATTQPAPMPLWLHSLLLHYTSSGRCCPTVPQKGNKGLGLTPTHLPGTKEAGELTGKQLGPRETKLDGGSGCTKTQLME
ncbi:hypothetical protein H8959_020330, partial [Pygathrix nigripes]